MKNEGNAYKHGESEGQTAASAELIEVMRQNSAALEEALTSKALCSGSHTQKPD